MSEYNKLKALKWSLYAILSGMLVELTGGLLANSLAVIADVTHASLDALTTFWLFYTTKISLKPPDANHTYGHGKIETIGSMFGGISLLGIGILLFYESIVRLSSRVTVSMGFTSIALLSVTYMLCVDIFRMTVLRKASKLSLSARANFFHAIVDFSSTIIALIGLSVASLGYYFGDSLSSLGLSILLSLLSLRLVYASSMELSDIAPAREYKAVESMLKNVDGLKGYRALRMRRVRSDYFIDLTILLSSTIDIEKAHRIASAVEERIKNLVKNATVTIHYEPIEEELPFHEQVEKIILKNRGVKGVHQITSTRTEEGTFLTLHIEIDPTLTLSEAHKVSEKIEEDIRILLPTIKETTVHIEGTSRVSRGEVVHGGKDVAAVYQVLYENPKIKKVSSVKVYESQGNKYVNVTCSLTGTDQIEEVHKEITSIEGKIKETIGECTVTIHPEPF
ncbi:MAG: cation-efflux pump [Nitrososphaeria archaeon]